MPDIFLSYSREDRTIARRFAEGFEQAGFSVWWDQDLRSGEAFDQVIEKAIHEAKAVIVLWSKQSVESRWVRAEATIGERNRTLMPVLIEPCQLPIMFELTHTANLAHWQGDTREATWQSFVAEVHQMMGHAPAPATPLAVVRAGRKHWYAAAATIAVLAAVVGWWTLRHATGDALASNENVTLAVLPFQDMSAAHDQQYFSDGLSEEILNQLTQIKRLTVAARASSFAFKDSKDDVRAIGKQLGVAHLLTGSIRKDGDSLRITAQLIDSATGVHQWSRTYDGGMSGIFAVQEEIARDVGRALSIKLDLAQIRRAEGGTSNVEAYEAFLAGLAQINGTPTVLLEAIDHAQQAVNLDPSFALAWQLLATAQVAYSQVTDKPIPPAALAAIGEANRLMPGSPDNLRFAAGLSAIDLQWEAALRQLQTARDAAARKGLATYGVDEDEGDLLFSAGRARDAIGRLQRAKLAQPPDGGLVVAVVRAYNAAGDQAMALSELEHGIEKTGSPDLRRVAYRFALSARDRTRIDLWLPSAIASEDAPPLVHTAMQPLLDQPRAALEKLRQLAGETQSPWDLSKMVTWAGYFRDAGFQLELLTRIARSNGSGRVALLANALWDPLASETRKLPGFKTLMRELGLVDFWRANGWSDFCKPVGTDDFQCR